MTRPDTIRLSIILISTFILWALFLSWFLPIAHNIFNSDDSTAFEVVCVFGMCSYAVLCAISVLGFIEFHSAHSRGVIFTFGLDEIGKHNRRIVGDLIRLLIGVGPALCLGIVVLLFRVLRFVMTGSFGGRMNE